MLRYVVVLGVVAGLAAAGPELSRSLLEWSPVAETVTTAAENSPERQTSALSGRTLVLKAGRNGHYYTKAWVNGRAVDTLIDTGASTIAIPRKVAAASGVLPRASDFTARAQTANGVVKAAPVRLREVRLGNIRLNNVDGMVLPDEALSITLIGMSALSRLSTVDIRNGTMRLVQ